MRQVRQGAERGAGLGDHAPCGSGMRREGFPEEVSFMLALEGWVGVSDVDKERSGISGMDSTTNLG